MLMEKLPFDGDKDDEIFKKIKKKQINFEGSEFKTKSMESVDLMKKMLFKSPDARISVKLALEHKWIQMYAIDQDDHDDIRFALENFRDFVHKTILQRAVTEYIINKLLSQR